MNRVYENHRSDARQLPLKAADRLSKYPLSTKPKHSGITTAATPN